MMFSTVAVNYTSLLLQVLAGRTWGRNAEAASVLSAFCVYTAFMAWNGMTEAFVYAVAHTGSQVTSLTIAHGIVGVFFMAIAPLFVNRYGTLGLVMTNCIAMGVRALYAIYFAAKYYCQVETKNNEKIAVWETAKRLIQDMFPPPIVLATYGVAFCMTRASLLRMQDYEREYSTEMNMTWLVTAAQHIAVGIVSVVMVAMCTFWYDTNFWQSIVRMFREKQE
jgi:oligosaccharide translocation protein RFT1